MDLRLIFFSSYETILSIIFGLITIFIVYKILNVTILKSDTDHALKNRNIALGIFGGTITICVLILVQTSILPSISALQTMVLGKEHITIKMMFFSFGYFLLFYLITTIICILVIFLSIALYMKATTKIDEVKELKDNNIAVAIMISLVILGMTIFIKPSVNRFISSLVNYEMIEKATETIEEGKEPPPSVEIMPEK